MQMIESLESRQFMSATAPAVKTLHETAGTVFTALLGKATPVTSTPIVRPAFATPAIYTSTFAVHAMIHWGDGTTSAGTIITKKDGTVDIDGTHTYAKPGRYHIVVGVSRYATGTGPQPQFIQLYKTLHDVAEVSAAS